MNPQDRQAIDTVFSRLDEVARSGSPRDDQAEQYIASQLSQRPGAAYYLAQTVLVQQQALEAAQQRLNQGGQNPQAGADDAGSFGRFGRSRPAAGGAGVGAAMAPPGTPPASGFGRSAGGGFLAGAAQTAVGVAGGMMLGSLLGGLFGSNNAEAAPAEPAAEEPGADAGAEDGGESWDDGGDMGDMGGDF